MYTSHDITEMCFGCTGAIKVSAVLGYRHTNAN